MFLSDCARCGRRELFGPRRVDALVNTASGLEVHYRCRACDGSNVMVTGQPPIGTGTPAAAIGPSAGPPAAQRQPGAA